MSPFLRNSSAHTKGVATIGALSLGICACAIIGCTPAPRRGQPDTSARESVRRIAKSLREDSYMRGRLDEGELGTGIHYPWMDSMRREAVRMALAETEFIWFGRPFRTRVLSINYFSEYDPKGSQITDPGRLSEIRSSGLDSQLRVEAVQGTMEAPWLRVHGLLPPLHGRGLIEMFDDGWLPPHNVLTRVPETMSHR